MRREVKRTTYNRTHQREYQRKMAWYLDTLETKLAQCQFDANWVLTCIEAECNLANADR